MSRDICFATTVARSPVCDQATHAKARAAQLVRTGKILGPVTKLPYRPLPDGRGSAPDSEPRPSGSGPGEVARFLVDKHLGCVIVSARGIHRVERRGSNGCSVLENGIDGRQNRQRREGGYQKAADYGSARGRGGGGR